jgi:hypothetical protein
MAVDWLDVAGWGNKVHVAPSLPDAHDLSEQRAEDGRG